MNECDEVRQRYESRTKKNMASLYSPLLPHIYLSMQEKERAIIRWINTCGITPVENKRVMEIGCGTGGNLLDLLRLGFQPENLSGNELLEERAMIARKRLPDAVRIFQGDAARMDASEGPFDIVFQSTVFTSILDDAFQLKLANRMWDLTKIGGGILWYDFIYNNPANPDVRGVPVKRIRELFPDGNMICWRLTLAPPIGRRVCRIHPKLYHVFNAIPWLRTHVMCWIRKKS